MACGTCDVCVARNPNPRNQAISDSQCAGCARNGQSWWPCFLDGQWSTDLCICEGSGGGGPSPTPPSPTEAPTSPTPTQAPAPTPPTPAPTVGDGSLCTETGPPCVIEPGEGISSWFTKDIFEEMFPHLCSPSCHGCDMLTYECLIVATRQYPDFANGPDVDDNMRELAAWLGEMSQETTGGGCDPNSLVNSDGTCSCGNMWCGDSCAEWGLCFVEEAGGTYCSQGFAGYPYPCTPGKSYKGRGPKQLSYNYNYGQFSEEFCGDKNILLDNPEWVASNPTLAWGSSMWFWFTGGACLEGESCKPSPHDVFLGTKPMCAGDVSGNRMYGLGWVTNVINGGLECGGAGAGRCDYRVHSRVRFYKYFCDILGVDPLADDWTEDNLYCDTQSNYATSPPQQC